MGKIEQNHRASVIVRD